MTRFFERRKSNVSEQVKSLKQWLAPNTKLRRILAGGCASLDGVEEADELLMTVALHVAADDFAAEHIQRGEQRGRAVPLTVMRHSRAPRPWAIAQPAPLGQTRGKDSTNNWYKVRAQVSQRRFSDERCR